MENWELSLDQWLTNPPEAPESHFQCDECDEPFYPDDKVYSLDGLCLCEECAREWLEQQTTRATEEQCYG